MPSGRLNGKIAIVTGGASGMGARQVLRFAAEGARVLVADIDVERGRAVAGEVGNAAIFEPLDVREEANWQRVVGVAEEHFRGPVNVLVNNAGILVEHPLEQTSLAEYRRVTDVMQVGVFLGMRTVAASMRRAGGGSIVNISSTAGMVGYPNLFAYCAAKWAVRGMSKAAAMDLAPSGIRVNSVHPGYIETPMIANNDNYPTDLVPLKRHGTVDEIASLVIYLVSDESGYCTGAEFVIDGGLTVS
jgi:3alpha(or 20beta)-hydroxysteroid dehydrogenase